MLRTIIHIVILVLPVFVLGNERRKLEAFRLEGAVRIDGNLDEYIWKTAPVATNFIENDPDPGEVPEYGCEVRVAFDDAAVYVGAFMPVDDPEDILQELTLRDNFGNADHFRVIINPYQDGINGTSFTITASGVQIDSKYSSNGRDFNWDAVWESGFRVSDEGWYAEFRIPFAALRFPEEPTQTWDINFERYVRKTREVSYWNAVYPTIQGFMNQAGTLTGIDGVEPPIRLFATPFIVTNVNNSVNKNREEKTQWDTEFSGGMDVKYGINDAFTLDMTVIPDFSQAISDNQVLNLTPFEVFFTENRAFFTEGIELFQKGNVFYSRRVGGRPVGFSRPYDDLKEDEIVSENPITSRLYNATKISGRTAKGLGVGFFNAISGQTFATITDEDGNTRQVQTDPLTNYNMLVLDQNLKNNSYVSVFNTNVWRDGSWYDANVTGTEFKLNTADQVWGVSGSAVLTQKYGEGPADLGHRWNLKILKQSGNFVTDIGYWEESDDYDPNDLGFNVQPNNRNFSYNVGYRLFETFSSFRRLNASLGVRYNRLYKPNEFVSFRLNPSLFLLSRRNNGYSLSFNLQPVEGKDFFEPRTSDFSRFYRFPENYSGRFFVSSNYNRRFAFDGSINYRVFDEESRQTFTLDMGPRFRVSNWLTLIYNFNYSDENNDIGYISPNASSKGFPMEDDLIIFGRRNRDTYVNTFRFQLIFTNTMGMTFRARHYWSTVNYDKFFELGINGELLETSYLGIDEGGAKLHDTNYNAFNIDMIYTWRFAPGSDLIFVWKDAIEYATGDAGLGFDENFGELMRAPRFNTFSLKVVYFVDFLYFKQEKREMSF